MTGIANVGPAVGHAVILIQGSGGEGFPGARDLPRDLADVSSVRTAAPAPDIHARKSPGEICHLDPEFCGITIFEMAEFAEIEGFHRHCIWQEASQTSRPITRCQAGFELGGMRAVDHVAARRIAGGRIDAQDRLF